MRKFRTEPKTDYLAGTTPRITFRLIGPDKIGFQPDTLTMSVYDYDNTIDPPTDSIINGRDDVDIIANCDTGGNVEVYLTADDMAHDVPGRETANCPKRRVLFAWSWSALPTKVGKQEVIISIMPDRETVAV